MASSSGEKPYTCTLSPAMLEKAKKELNEDPKTRLMEIKTLRERLEKVPGLQFCKDDAFLLRFLRARKFDQERTYSLVLGYYRNRAENPDIYENLTPRRFESYMAQGLFGVLKDRAPDGRRIIIIKAKGWEPDRFPMATVVGYTYLVLCKLLEEEETQVCGYSFLVDLEGYTWQQMTQFTPHAMKQFALLWQETIPGRFRGIDYLNEPPFFDVLFALMKQIMKKKLFERINLHGTSLESLHKRIPKEILPQELGGKLPPYNYQEWAEAMLACEAQFADENKKYGMLNMTIPAKDQKKADATESLGGTFRKLNVD